MPAPRLWTVAVLEALWVASASPAAPLEAYGRLPSLEEASLSPDGTRIAFVRDLGTERVIAITALADRGVVGVLRIKDRKVRGVEWADDGHLLIVTSQTSLPDGFIGAKAEWQGLQVYDIARKTSTVVPNGRMLHEQSVMNVNGRGFRSTTSPGKRRRWSRMVGCCMSSP